MADVIIGRMLLDVTLEFPGIRQQAEQGVLASLKGGRLEQLIEQCLAALPEPSRTVSADRLEIDMGRLHLGMSHQVVEDQARAAIADGLRKLLLGTTDERLPNGRIADFSALEAMDYFLRYGVIHWTRPVGTSAAALISAAMDHDAGQTAALLRNTWARPDAAQRLAEHLATVDLLRAVQLSLPDAGAHIVAIHHYLNYLLITGLDVEQRARFAIRIPPQIDRALAHALTLTAASIGIEQRTLHSVFALFSAELAGVLHVPPWQLSNTLAALARVDVSGNPLAAVLTQAKVPEAEIKAAALPVVLPLHLHRAVLAYLATGSLPTESDVAVSEGMLRAALRHWTTVPAGEGTQQAQTQMAAAAIVASATTGAAARQRLAQLLGSKDAASVIDSLMSQRKRAADPSSVPDPQGSDPSSAAQADIDLFFFLIEFGAIPWWARDKAEGSIDAWLLDFLAQGAGAVAAHLLQASDHRRTILIEAMASRLSPAALSAIISSVAPKLMPEAGHWLEIGSDYTTDFVNSGNSADSRSGRTIPSLDDVLCVQARMLLDHIFDPHAPPLTWPEMLTELSYKVGRRLGMVSPLVGQTIIGDNSTDRREDLPDAVAPISITEEQDLMKPRRLGQPEGRRTADLDLLATRTAAPDTILDPSAIVAPGAVLENVIPGAGGSEEHAVEPLQVSPLGAPDADVVALARQLLSHVPGRSRPVLSLTPLRRALREASKRARLIGALSTTDLDQLVILLAAPGTTLPPSELAILSRAVDSSLSGTTAGEWSQAALAQLLSELSGSDAGVAVDPAVFLSFLIDPLANARGVKTSDVAHRLVQEVRRHSPSNSEALIQTLLNISGDTSASDRAAAHTTPISDDPVTDQSQSRPAKKALHSFSEESTTRPRELLFVGDAGAVLLWPFLTHFFERVGLLVEGKFPDDPASARGVMLIHHLVTSSTETQEPLLTLPKILCGVPFEKAVSPYIELTDLEQSVSDELLHVVCQNWPPLRNSSVEALRESFLLRNGSLTWLEEQLWLVKVSPMPYDMLLSQLPWTLSTFKLGFMENPMMVQWGNS